MYRILVPLDGSALAERAIPWADALAGALDAEVELVSVIGPDAFPSEPLAAGLAAQVIDTETEAVQATLALEAELFARGRPTRQEVLYGPPGEAISIHAQAAKIDLIVMSSHGRGDLGRAFLGSVADQVIRESRVPVLVLRGAVPSPPVPLPRTILVPLDGSEWSEAILAHVKPLARALGSTLVLFWQVDWQPQTEPVEGAGIPLETIADGGWTDMVEYLAHVAAGLLAAGIKTDVRVGLGYRAESIVRFAAQAQVDLIAMSTHGRHGFGRWLRGSVADEVLAHATIPVLTVRPATAPAHAHAEVDAMPDPASTGHPAERDELQPTTV